MELNNNAEIYLPFEENREAAMDKTTHMVFSAHQDDIEIMAQHGILSCFGDPNSWFAAVVCSDGAGSPRSGIYQNYSDDEMKEIRIIEQKKAAVVGEYSFLALLKYSSAQIKDITFSPLVEDIKTLLLQVRPKIIYTHSPADKHDTHVAVVLRVLSALRQISQEYRPEFFYGCEVWRGLDWVNDDEKIVLDVSGHPALRASLLGVFDSQIEGGKRYDLAALGRQASNATFYASHDTDKTDAATYALDLLPLIDSEDIYGYIDGYIRRFSEDIKSKIEKFR